MTHRRQFFVEKSFTRSLQKLKRNTVHAKAAQKIEAMLYRIQKEDNPLRDFNPTANGETRIANCVKYELQGRARLITVQQEDHCVLVFVGDHSDCDAWLNSNRGCTFTVGVDRRIAGTFVTTGADSSIAEANIAPSGFGELFTRIPDEAYDALTEGLPNSKRRQLEALEVTSEDSELKAIIGVIPDEVQRKALYDVFTLLRQFRLEAALARADLYLGRAKMVSELSAEQLEEVLDSTHVRRVPQDSVKFADMVKQLTSSSAYKDWMLFLHPEQERIVIEDFDGPAKLVGVSGSGKTCVVVRRAVRMAELYPDERVLILTLNPALATLIDGLVSVCAPEDARARIEARPLFNVCRDLLLGFEPARRQTVDQVTSHWREHIDAIWQEYYRCELNNPDAQAFRPVHDSLLTRGWNPERYLREEVDWLRSAVGPFDREDYLNLRRQGRALPLPEHYRRAVLEGAQGWDQKMRDIGAVDLLGLVELLARHVGKIRPLYRSILVDEGQDFGNTELSLVRRLVARGVNDLFIAGDAAQAVSTKYQSFDQVGIAIPRERSRRLSLNYRNSRDVLEAAFAILETNLSQEMMDRDDFDILQPELSSFQGNTPLLLQAEDVKDELAWTIQHLRNLAKDAEDWKACIAVCGYTLHELQEYGRSLGLPVLDGTVQLDDGAIFLSDLEQTKGFEFNVVCIINCSSGVIPDSAAPVDEQHRDLARFYVAMTRARTDLILSWSRGPSPYLAGVGDHFYAARWEDLVGDVERERVPAPPRLENLRDEGIHLKDALDMTGDEFLFTPHALGLSAELIAKLRELVDGRGLLKGKQQVKWRRMRDALRDAADDVGTKVLWGREVHSQLLELGSRIQRSREQ